MRAPDIPAGPPPENPLTTYFTVLACAGLVFVAVAVFGYLLALREERRRDLTARYLNVTPPYNLAAELGRAARQLPPDEHEWWVRVQTPVLMAAELAAACAAAKDTT